MKNQKTRPFEKENIFEVNQPAPGRIKNLLFARILPPWFLKAILPVLFLLFISPFLFLWFVPSLRMNPAIGPMIATIGILFAFFSILAFFILVHYRIPYMQELKEKFGYTE